MMPLKAFLVVVISCSSFKYGYPWRKSCCWY